MGSKHGLETKLSKRVGDEVVLDKKWLDPNIPNLSDAYAGQYIEIVYTSIVCRNVLGLGSSRWR